MVEGTPHHISLLLIHYTNLAMEPTIIGNHGRGHYNLTYVVGTISQVENRTFRGNFDNSGPYPSNQRVISLFLSSFMEINLGIDS